MIKINVVFYDFEVFRFNWLVVIINYETKEKTIIIDNREQLVDFYNEHKNSIWVGYNSRMYDQFILKAILKNENPFRVSCEIVNNGKNGYHVLKNLDEYPLNNFDISTGFHSLKQLEGFIGSKIKETSVNFDIDRKLNSQEIEETIEYCTHDVEQTIEIFNHRKEEFDSQLSLIQAFDLPMTMFNKTKAQLSAHVLGAKRIDGRRDEFNIIFPDTLKIEKYKEIVDWYKDEANRDYKKKLYVDVAEVPHIFGWGGIHGAINNYSDVGLILCCDVSSLYPSIMIEYDFLSRNVTNPSKYKEIRDTRLKLKAEKNPMQLPLKIVLNATYGTMKDKHNDLYDPLQANNVCVAGQLLLLDLIEKLEPYCKLIQSNTDGLFLKVDNEESITKIKNIAKEWEKRTKLDLEWELFSKIYQKDVNNYIIINSEGKYKSKGAYVKKLSSIDYDLPIVNNALINYFVQDKPLEQTINECNSLKEFQKIVKISSLYKYALHGDKKIKEKVLRVFASNKNDAQGVFKVKSEDRIEKIANTPEKCFIYNENVNDVAIPDELDKQYYMDIAEKRLSDFLDVKTTKKINNIPSEIKFINQYTKDEILKIANDNYKTFVDLVTSLVENGINSRQIEIMTKLNYFKRYGRNKKLIMILDEFKTKYNKNHKDKTKKERLEYLYDYEKSLDDVSFSIQEQMKFDIEFTDKLTTIYDLPRGTSYVMEIETKNSPRIVAYGLSTGQVVNLKILKKEFNKQPFEQGDIIQFFGLKKKPRTRFVGKDSKGKPIFESIVGESEIWAESYQKIELK